MYVPFVMRNAEGAVVAGEPTVALADGTPLTPEADGDGWTVDAPPGRVSVTLTGAVPLDFVVPDTSNLADKDDVAAIIGAMPDIPPPDVGATITPATIGAGGVALGRVMPYGVVTAYIGTTAHYQFTADADGGYSYVLPYGSTWTLNARRSGYKTMTAGVTT